MSTSTQNVGGKRIGLLAAAAIALVVIAAFVGCASGEEATATDQTPVATEASENTANARAVEVATGFLEAYGAFDVEQAMTYLADDATIASMGANDDLRLLLSYLEATGYQQTSTPVRNWVTRAPAAFAARSPSTPSGPASSDGVLSAAAPSISTFVTERSSGLRSIGRSTSSRLRCGSPSPAGCPRPTRRTPR